MAEICCPTCGVGIKILVETTKQKSVPLATFREFMDGLCRDYWGLKPGDPDPGMRLRVGGAYKRHGKDAKDILLQAGMDPKFARRAVDAIGKRMDRDGLSWTLSTIADHFTDFGPDALSAEIYENETKNKQRFR